MLEAVRVVLITDRRLMGTGGPAAMITRAVPAERRDVMVQVREHDLPGGAMLELARAVRALRRVPVIVNGSPTVARYAGVSGVHLREVGPSVAEARGELGSSAVIGVSRHSVSSAVAAAADGAQLVQLGPIWATPSKTGMGEPLGLDVLRAARAALPASVVLCAVGGIDGPERAAAAAEAGADAIAVIRAVWTADDPATVVEELAAAVQCGRTTRSALR